MMIAVVVDDGWSSGTGREKCRDYSCQRRACWAAVEGYAHGGCKRLLLLLLLLRNLLLVAVATRALTHLPVQGPRRFRELDLNSMVIPVNMSRTPCVNDSGTPADSGCSTQGATHQHHTSRAIPAHPLLCLCAAPCRVCVLTPPIAHHDGLGRRTALRVHDGWRKKKRRQQ